jgi:type VI secretion system secreted protein VgrG
MQSIELKVGQNSIKVDQMGVTIKGLMLKFEGTVMTQVKGLMTQVNGDAMLTVKGGLTMIN